MTDSRETHSHHSLRLWTAVAILPFCTAALAFLGFPLISALGGQPGHSSDAAVAIAAVAGVFAGAVTIFGAVPLAFWRLDRGPIPLRRSVLDGLLLGNAPFVLYVVAFVIPLTIAHMASGTMSGRWLSPAELVVGALRVIATGSLLGMASAAIFWFLAIRERDHRPTSMFR